MRQRKAKDLEARLEVCREYLIENRVRTNVSNYVDKITDIVNEVSRSHDFLQKYFDDDRELFVEIGCGKGNFILKKARENPDKNYIAIEGQETVILRALEKAAELELPNLKFMCTFVHSMSDVFNEGQLAGIYLNFSDPWPKARHAKRRLTYRSRLKDYQWALRDGGFVEFKTDNDPLYEFSLGEIHHMGYKIVEETTDLHSSDYESRHTTTEYEDKFRANGKNINYVKFIV